MLRSHSIQRRRSGSLDGTTPPFAKKRANGSPNLGGQFLFVCLIAVLIVISLPVSAHDIITTPVTWDREISRIFYSRCVACHREGGMAFSLMQYQETFPWRTAIKEEILERRMPPWGAVKGFGDFRNDQALTPEQLELVTSWSQGGSPEGEAKDLPAKDKLNEMMKESIWFDAGSDAGQSKHP